MVSRGSYIVLMLLFGIAAIAVLVIAAMLFFQPQKEPTGNKFLDCISDSIEVTTLKRCFEKHPEFIDKGRIDAMLYSKARRAADASVCSGITKDDVRLTCIAGVNNDKTACYLIKDELAKALCLGRWDAGSCDNLNGEAKRDCSVEISKEPEKCLLLPEEEQAFCIALKKKDPLLCPSLPTYYQQIRCMLESDATFLQKLEEYDVFRNFIDIAVKENQPVNCKSIADPNLKKVCAERFQAP